MSNFVRDQPVRRSAGVETAGPIVLCAIEQTAPFALPGLVMPSMPCIIHDGLHLRVRDLVLDDLGAFSARLDEFDVANRLVGVEHFSKGGQLVGRPGQAVVRSEVRRDDVVSADIPPAAAANGCDKWIIVGHCTASSKPRDVLSKDRASPRPFDRFC